MAGIPEDRSDDARHGDAPPGDASAKASAQASPKVSPKVSPKASAQASPKASPKASADGTMLAMPATDRLWVTIGFPLFGLVLSLGLPLLARWALGLGTALPVRPVFWVLGWPDRPWKILVAAALGVLAGVGVALAAVRGSATVTVTDDEVHIEVDGQSERFDRSAVAAVFLDGNRLVLLDRQSRCLLRQELGCPPESMEQAMRTHRYPWLPADPYGELFQQWQPGADELPSQVDTVLLIRKEALQKKAYPQVRQLDAVLAELGYYAREDGTQQYWRPLVSS